MQRLIINRVAVVLLVQICSDRGENSIASCERSLEKAGKCSFCYFCTRYIYQIPRSIVKLGSDGFIIIVGK